MEHFTLITPQKNHGKIAKGNNARFPPFRKVKKATATADTAPHHQKATFLTALASATSLFPPPLRYVLSRALKKKKNATKKRIFKQLQDRRLTTATQTKPAQHTKKPTLTYIGEKRTKAHTRHKRRTCSGQAGFFTHHRQRQHTPIK